MSSIGTISKVHLNDESLAVDAGGFVLNFNGNVQVLQQTWNTTKNTFDQKDILDLPAELRNLLDQAWDGAGGQSGIADQIRDQAVSKTGELVSKLGSGYGISGGGVINVSPMPSNLNELRVKQEGDIYLLLKYRARGSEDFFLAHPDCWSRPTSVHYVRYRTQPAGFDLQRDRCRFGELLL